MLDKCWKLHLKLFVKNYIDESVLKYRLGSRVSHQCYWVVKAPLPQTSDGELGLYTGEGALKWQSPPRRAAGAQFTPNCISEVLTRYVVE